MGLRADVLSCEMQADLGFFCKDQEPKLQECCKFCKVQAVLTQKKVSGQEFVGFRAGVCGAQNSCPEPLAIFRAAVLKAL